MRCACAAKRRRLTARAGSPWGARRKASSVSWVPPRFSIIARLPGASFHNHIARKSRRDKNASSSSADSLMGVAMGGVDRGGWTCGGFICGGFICGGAICLQLAHSKPARAIAKPSETYRIFQRHLEITTGAAESEGIMGIHHVDYNR